MGEIVIAIPFAHLIRSKHPICRQSLEKFGKLLSVLVFLFQNTIYKEHKEVGVEIWSVHVGNAFCSIDNIAFAKKKKLIGN